MCELKNHTEVVVRQALQDYLNNNKVPCSCECCQADIMTLALNHLPPQYYSSSQGEILTQLKAQEPTFQVLIMTEVISAIQMISAKPSHQ